MERVSQLSDSYYFKQDDPEQEEVQLEYPVALLRLIDRPSGPEWFQDYLRSLDRDALSSDDPQDRIRVTRDDPLLFALTYLIDHLHSPETKNKLSFAEFHLDLLEHAREWTERVTEPRQFRDCYVAPRGVGKSTWLFLILPVWAAAHGHVRFIAAFSDSADQAKNHLATIRGEFDTNDLLIQDFPLLCAPKVRRTGGALAKKTVSARVDKIEQSNDFVMIAKGSGTAARGLKVGKRRPDLLILDDIEPGEERYSESVMRFRLRWLLETVFHLNDYARVIIVGTVTAPGSIMHQLVESELHPSEDTPDWIEDQGIDVHYYAPILLNDDGTERSCWPTKWPLEYLKAHENKQDYKKEFLNQPVNAAGDFWTSEDFIYAERETISDILVIDPIVSDTASSHDTGIAIVGRAAPDLKNPENFRPIVVKYATRVRVPPAKLRQTVINFIDLYPEIGLIRIESNQGGETWREVLHDIPLRVELTWSKLSKVTRNSRLLNCYQRGWVVHHHPLNRLEQEMCAYTGGDNDMIDAVEAGVRKFVQPPKPRVGGGTFTYGRRTPDRLLAGFGVD